LTFAGFETFVENIETSSIEMEISLATAALSFWFVEISFAIAAI
jgi:hypothetical protein